MNARRRLLVVSHVPPFPRNAGQNQRVYYTLRAARERFHVTFASFAAAEERERTRQRLLEICDDVVVLTSRYTGGAFRKVWHRGMGKLYTLVTGNTVIDALHHVVAMPYDWLGGPLRHLPADKRLVLFTAHRRESFGHPLRELCEGLRDLAQRFRSDGVHFVYPVHMNPAVRRPVEQVLAAADNVSLINPLDYLSLVHLMKRSTLILTDSGGIQEEAPGLGVPVLVMRETTERPEGVEAGVVKLVGISREAIYAEAGTLLTDSNAREAMTKRISPYGDGYAAQRIVSHLLRRGPSV